MSQLPHSLNVLLTFAFCLYQRGARRLFDLFRYETERAMVRLGTEGSNFNAWKEPKRRHGNGKHLMMTIETNVERPIF